MIKKKTGGALVVLLISALLPFFVQGADSTFYWYQKLATDDQRIEFLNDNINAELSTSPGLADSMAGMMQQVAEFSRNRVFMCKVYYYLARQYINFGGLRNNLATGEAYAFKCLQLSKESGADEFTIAAYLSLARVNRAKSDNQKALEYNNLALSLAVNYGNDSLTSVCYTGLSNTWMSMNNKLASFQNRLSAREFAEKSKSPSRISTTILDLAGFYLSINEYEKAKDLYYHTMDLARSIKEWEDVMEAQRSLAEIYTTTGQKMLGMSFYTQAMKLADSVGRNGYKVNIYLDLINYFMDHETAENAMNYFKSEPAIARFLTASGQLFYVDEIKGFYFSETKRYDSADYYFARVLNGAEGKMNMAGDFNLYKYMATMYGRRGLNDQALTSLKKSLAIADSLNNIDLKREISLALDSFYLKTGNYKEAVYFNSQYHFYNDSLRKLSEQKDLLSIEIDNENKRKIKQEEVALAEKERRNNIQYLGISAAIATIFILLVLSGAFKISIPVIKALGFFAFIFLFEFIILLADNQIHEWTHGEPWKVMGFKIILVAILFPLHHWLEHKVIHYLLTRDMLPNKAFKQASAREKMLTLKEEEEL